MSSLSSYRHRRRRIQCERASQPASFRLLRARADILREGVGARPERTPLTSAARVRFETNSKLLPDVPPADHVGFILKCLFALFELQSIFLCARLSVKNLCVFVPRHAFFTTRLRCFPTRQPDAFFPSHRLAHFPPPPSARKRRSAANLQVISRFQLPCSSKTRTLFPHAS